MKIHFIGIGGIGVSALAKYYIMKGHKVSGSDLASSEITESLEALGAKIYIGPHTGENINKGLDLIIFSPAVPKNNPELRRGGAENIKCQSYPQSLGEMTKKYFTIAVSGTHGKSTTTAMIGLLLIKAGLDPTIIIGTKIKELGDSNCRVGKSQYFVIEADEHKASFLNYWPKIIVINNIEKDHLDFYKNFGNILKTFKKYVSHLPANGVLVANKDDKNVLRMIPRKTKINFAVKDYTVRQRDAKKLKDTLNIPGAHNISNALAALTVARVLNIPDDISFKSLSEYNGSWRRFEILKENLLLSNPKRRITLISDYGHHPTEILATMKGAVEKFVKRKVWCVFQPHQYQRTYYLLSKFVDAFRSLHDDLSIERTIITDIYEVSGRETEIIRKKINSEKLVKKINRPSVTYLPKEKINDFLKKELAGGEVVIIMGAGDIYIIANELANGK